MKWNKNKNKRHVSTFDCWKASKWKKSNKYIQRLERMISCRTNHDVPSLSPAMSPSPSRSPSPPHASCASPSLAAAAATWNEGEHYYANLHCLPAIAAIPLLLPLATALPHTNEKNARDRPLPLLSAALPCWLPCCCCFSCVCDITKWPIAPAVTTGSSLILLGFVAVRYLEQMRLTVAPRPLASPALAPSLVDARRNSSILASYGFCSCCQAIALLPLSHYFFSTNDGQRRRSLDRDETMSPSIMIVLLSLPSRWWWWSWSWSSLSSSLVGMIVNLPPTPPVQMLLLFVHRLRRIFLRRSDTSVAW